MVLIIFSHIPFYASVYFTSWALWNGGHHILSPVFSLVVTGLNIYHYDKRKVGDKTMSELVS